MKSLSIKKLYLAWLIACLFAISITLALTISHWIFIATIFFAIGYIVIVIKVLRCPNCNKMESLINLSYAINHQYYCRNCGQEIIIRRRKDE